MSTEGCEGDGTNGAEEYARELLDCDWEPEGKNLSSLASVPNPLFHLSEGLCDSPKS